MNVFHVISDLEQKESLSAGTKTGQQNIQWVTSKRAKLFNELTFLYPAYAFYPLLVSSSFLSVNNATLKRY